MRGRSESTEGFYHLSEASLEGSACRGLACFLARARDPETFERALAGSARVHCLGKCYAAPAAFESRTRPAFVVASKTSIVLDRVAHGGAKSFDAYVARGGYRALAIAQRTDPRTLVDAIARSGLRGRGGGFFPTGEKMRAVAAGPPPRFVVANADEGDPGAYVDRFLLEEDPHAVLEGIAIAARIVGATDAYVYLRCEYPDARRSLEVALDEATRAGVLGSPADGRPRVAIALVTGRGSYVCGEESALLESIEERRPFVRVRPPYPSERGLFDSPTLVQNVETLVNLPFIVERGAEAFASLGTSRCHGTKVFSLSSLFARPGLYEVELGTSLRTLVEELGGGLVSGTLVGVIVGGPLAGIVPPQLLDVPLAFEELHAIGASLGHGGVVAFDERTSMRELVNDVFEFAAFESCGRCVPCRLGSRLVADATQGATHASFDTTTFEQLAATLARTSLCGLGGGLGEFATSVLRHYRTELASCFA